MKRRTHKSLDSIAAMHADRTRLWWTSPNFDLAKEFGIAMRTVLDAVEREWSESKNQQDFRGRLAALREELK
jgi:hypothetical protein